jgi:hypothetical protein
MTKDKERKEERDRDVKIVDLSNAISKENTRKLSGALLATALVVCAISAAVAQGSESTERYLDELPTDGEEDRIIPWEKPPAPQSDCPEPGGCRSRLPV